MAAARPPPVVMLDATASARAAQIRDHHRGAVPRETPRGGGADPGATGCDDRDLTVESSGHRAR